MSHAEFTPTTNEFIGTAAGHTIGMVIPNIDPEVRTLLKIPSNILPWEFLLQEPELPHRHFP